MLNIKKTILLTAISLTIAACSSTPYKKTSWANSNVESDWDIDSAVCLNKSQQLSKADLRRIEQIKLDADKMNQATQQSVNNSIQQGGRSDVANAVGALSAMFFASEKVTAEHTVKDENFNQCLENKGWDKK